MVRISILVGVWVVRVCAPAIADQGVFEVLRNRVKEVSSPPTGENTGVMDIKEEILDQAVIGDIL